MTALQMPDALFMGRIRAAAAVSCAVLGAQKCDATTSSLEFPYDTSDDESYVLIIVCLISFYLHGFIFRLSHKFLKFSV